MSINIFDKRKEDILGKQDKSSKGSWDKKIVPLCERINELKNYYTTSSCSGRILLIRDSVKKTYGLFLKVHHDVLSFESFKEDLVEISKIETKNVVNFKQEPCALHVACRTLEDAQKLVDVARSVGWKKSGIISSSKRFVVEMFGSSKLEFPLLKEGKILAEDIFLREVLSRANINLEKSWEEINLLFEKIKDF
ncbi:hypothetical protein B6U91_00985 [Candidatus Pacearchaeota archaeon ex4484_71]|nr:MAG: hypothetical protein B6U91_00985 [Candidatus Pacearchaeota archaeon ex4484_71]